MRTRLFALIRLAALLSFFGAPSLVANPCPDRVQYQSGSTLKQGNTYYYPGGSLVARDGVLYYPSGGYLRREGTTYYPNGTYLQRDNTLYYPTGSYLKREDTYYYSSGSYLKRDDTFYYPTGTFARHGGKLYHEDGTSTVFPVRLFEAIDSYGSIEAEVRAASEVIAIDFSDLVVEDQGARVSAVWNGKLFTRFEIWLNTGVPGEDLLVYVQGNQITCRIP